MSDTDKFGAESINAPLDNIDGSPAFEHDKIMEIGREELPAAFTSIRTCEVAEPELSDEQMQKEANIRSNRRPLVLSLIGLFLSPFFGVGVFFSAFSLVLSVVMSKEFKSVTLKWAKIISAVGVIINVCVFVLLLSYYYNNPPLPVIPS